MSRKILVVDDDRAMVRTLVDILRQRGWDSRGAYSGEEALQLVQQGGYPVVLMDITMPGMGGVAAFQAMKATHPEVRVIFMTAHTSAEVMRGAEGAGAWRVMPKPLDIRSLLTLID